MDNVSNYPLHHLIDRFEPDDFHPITPQIERVGASAIRRPKSQVEQVAAAAKTTAKLFHAGMEAVLDKVEEQTAQALLIQQVTQDGTPAPLLPATTVMQPGVILKLAALIAQYDHKVVKTTEQLRMYTINRLIEESAPTQGAGVRMKALELIGKMTDVGLFTERAEITVKHEPTDKLTERLRDRLAILIDPKDITEVYDGVPPKGDE